MRKVTQIVGPTSRIVILVVGAIVALGLLIFFLWKPISPTIEPETPLGTHAESLPY